MGARNRRSGYCSELVDGIVDTLYRSQSQSQSLAIRTYVEEAKAVQ